MKVYILTKDESIVGVFGSQYHLREARQKYRMKYPKSKIKTLTKTVRGNEEDDTDQRKAWGCSWI